MRNILFAIKRYADKKFLTSEYDTFREFFWNVLGSNIMDPLKVGVIWNDVKSVWKYVKRF